MHEGQRGWDVAALQFLLHERGFEPGGFDGGFGPNTQSAVRRYQAAAGVAADGVAGSSTLNVLQTGQLITSSPSTPVRFFQPVPGLIGDRFGWIPPGRWHTGIDIPAPRGTPIHAGGVGVVVFALGSGASGLDFFTVFGGGQLKVGAADSDVLGEVPGASILFLDSGSGEETLADFEEAVDGEVGVLAGDVGEEGEDGGLVAGELLFQAVPGQELGDGGNGGFGTCLAEPVAQHDHPADADDGAESEREEFATADGPAELARLRG